ncbi:MAG: hypothetical protein IJT39_02190 [Bacteroidales bacterium]|nr:hypothetical protein [Bacteroidales bacterium]
MARLDLTYKITVDSRAITAMTEGYTPTSSTTTPTTSVSPSRRSPSIHPISHGNSASPRLRSPRISVSS